MGSRGGRRVINLANLPRELLMPSSFSNITGIALKNIPSASKMRTLISRTWIEIKRVLESLYGFEVETVQALNMEGNKKKRGELLIAKPRLQESLCDTEKPFVDKTVSFSY